MDLKELFDRMENRFGDYIKAAEALGVPRNTYKGWKEKANSPNPSESFGHKYKIRQIEHDLRICLGMPVRKMKGCCK